MNILRPDKVLKPPTMPPKGYMELVQIFLVFGTISITHFAAGGQATVNNDSGRARQLFVSGRKNPEKVEEGRAYL